MSYGSAPKMYGLASSVDAVPLSLSSSTLNRPIPSNIKTVAISSQSSTQSANGFSSMQIPTGAGTGYLRPSSVYLKCRVTCTPGVGNNWSFDGPTHSASAIIRQLTISLGNQIVEQLNHYNALHASMLLHTTSRNFIDGDSAILENSSIARSTIDNNDSVDVCIPLISGLFCGQKAIPLFLLSSPILVQVDYETVANAIRNSANADAPYTVSNVQLVYDHIMVDDSYKQAVKMALADPQNPKLYQLNVNQFLNGRLAKPTTSVTYNVGTSVSSLKGVLWTIINEPAVPDFQSQRVFRSREFNNTCDFNVLVDGQKVNNIQINDVATAYAEMNKVWGNLFDPVLTYGLATSVIANKLPESKTSYNTVGFLGGVSTNRFNEMLSMTGVPCQSLTFTLTTQNTDAADNLYFFIPYETILTIDANGNATLIR